MIDFIEGAIVSKTPAAVTLQAGAVGYLLRIPVSTYEALPPVGQQARLLTHVQVREDDISLYAFLSEAERDLFRLLLSVSQVGPRLALNVLSSCPVEDFKRYIAAEDADTIAAVVKGVGNKTARRLIAELRPEIEELGRGRLPAHTKDAVADAVQALVSLGEKRSAAQRAVSAALDRLGPDADQQALVRAALSR